MNEDDQVKLQLLEKTGYWGEFGAGVLFYCPKTNHILLDHRSSEVLNPDTYGIYGGAGDETETPLETAKREAFEETQHAVSNLTEVYVYTDNSFAYHTFLCCVDEEFIPKPLPEHEWETQGYIWCSPSNIPNNTMDAVKEMLASLF